MNQEKYQPSPEEMKSGEEMMGETEALMSTGREDRQKYLESLGAEGHVELYKDVMANYDGDESKPVWTEAMEAEINGKTINVCRIFKEGEAKTPIRSYAPEIPLAEAKTDSFFGVVEVNGNPVKLTHEEAEKIFRKFAPAAMKSGEENSLTKAARVELKQKGEEAEKNEGEAARQEELKDLL